MARQEFDDFWPSAWHHMLLFIGCHTVGIYDRNGTSSHDDRNRKTHTVCGQMGEVRGVRIRVIVTRRNRSRSADRNANHTAVIETEINGLGLSVS